MTEQELIKKIKQLKQIKPAKEWVILSKKQLFVDSQPQPKFRFAWPHLDFQFGFRKLALQPALVIPAILLVAIGAFFIVQNKETIQETVISEQNKAEYYVKKVEEKTQEFKKIAEGNKVRNISLADEELAKAIEKAIQHIPQSSGNPEQSLKLVKPFVSAETMLREVRQWSNTDVCQEEMEALATKLEHSIQAEVKQGEKKLAQYLITELKENSFKTEKQTELLKEMKGLYENGNYAEVCSLYLIE